MGHLAATDALAVVLDQQIRQLPGEHVAVALARPTVEDPTVWEPVARNDGGVGRDVGRVSV
jgi:hypothetical protein